MDLLRRFHHSREKSPANQLPEKKWTSDVKGSTRNASPAPVMGQTLNRVSALYLANVPTFVLAAVYELPAHGSAVVGTDSRSCVSP
jgi:hypothetical protein